MIKDKIYGEIEKLLSDYKTKKCNEKYKNQIEKTCTLQEINTYLEMIYDYYYGDE